MDYAIFIDKVNGLSRDDEFKFTYKSKEYKFKCFDKSERFGDSFSVSNGIYSSMNVDKITKQYVTLYDYNMMSQRTTQNGHDSYNAFRAAFELLNFHGNPVVLHNAKSSFEKSDNRKSRPRQLVRSILLSLL